MIQIYWINCVNSLIKIVIIDDMPTEGWYMADDFNNKMEQVLKILQNEQMMNNLRGVLSSMTPQNNNDSTANQNTYMDEQPPAPSITQNNYEPKTIPIQEPIQNNTQSTQTSNQGDIFIAMQKILERISNPDDPGVNLLMALKPYLNDKRKSNIDSAVKLLGLTKITSVMNEINKQ